MCWGSARALAGNCHNRTEQPEGKNSRHHDWEQEIRVKTGYAEFEMWQLTGDKRKLTGYYQTLITYRGNAAWILKRLILGLGAVTDHRSQITHTFHQLQWTVSKHSQPFVTMTVRNRKYQRLHFIFSCDTNSLRRNTSALTSVSTKPFIMLTVFPYITMVTAGNTTANRKLLCFHGDSKPDGTG